MDPPPLAAGERGNRCLPVDVGNQSGDDVANPGIAGPFVVGALAVTTVDLPPWGSTFVLCGLARGGMPEASSSFRRDVSIDAWTLTVSGNDVEGGAFAANLTDLPDWRDVEALRYASSPGTYRANVNVGALTSGEHAWLVVPWVHGAAEVRVNGTPAASSCSGSLLL